MTYIIQTNTSIDNLGIPRDFQSMIFPYESWDKYRNDLLNEHMIHEIIHGTLTGNIKPRRSKIEEIIINDDLHLEIIICNGFVRTNIKAYKVDKERFQFVCRDL